MVGCGDGGAAEQSGEDRAAERGPVSGWRRRFPTLTRITRPPELRRILPTQRHTGKIATPGRCRGGG